jgi:hypothetical protein
MTEERNDTRPLQSPLSGLERSLIDEFLRRRGYDPAHLEQLPDTFRDGLLKEASLYASARLAEVESRAHYVHEIHEGSLPGAKSGHE